MSIGNSKITPTIAIMMSPYLIVGLSKSCPGQPLLHIFGGILAGNQFAKFAIIKRFNELAELLLLLGGKGGPGVTSHC